MPLYGACNFEAVTFFKIKHKIFIITVRNK